MVYRAGDSVQLVYFLRTGAVSIWQPHECRPDTGVAVEYVEAPMFFGEMELLKQEGSRSRFHTAVAVGAVEACVIPAHVFKALVLSEVRAQPRTPATHTRRAPPAARH